MKKIINLILLFSGLVMMTACQKSKESSPKTSSSSTISSKNKTESKSSDKNSSSNNDKSSSKPEIEEISAEEYEKKIGNKSCAGELIFFKTPGSKESDEGLKKFSKQCQEIGEKLYVVDISTDAGKKIIKKHSIIKTPYDGVLLREGGEPEYLDLSDQETSTKVLDVLVKRSKEK
ncbi:hypothetical protein [Xylocopilactobacillus apicola]|uniref:Lipoprotein n=1 Tax=Xylocopilactobacillus apicola TaxID=2932184 RepID=A0AAU9DGQ3_9LACO|nr:hypothetical protein [Xylocopilactobacillus apicola]BDR59145.1 hypothetical protein XA3_15860 [Xylocopilactobacillus apicola]